MESTFFIVPESFKYSGETKNEIKAKIENFAIDLRRIKETSGNEIFCNPDVYNIQIFENITISDVLYTNTNLFDRDTNQQLRIIWELQETNDSIEKICQNFLPNHTKKKCYGLIAFNPITSVVPEYQLIYGIDAWFNFKRYFLGLYPIDSDFFINECKIYFEALFFHENNKNTVKVLFPNCVKRIIHHLTELNNKFPVSKTIPYNRKNTLDIFNTTYINDGQKASAEGNINKKDSLTFTFINDGQISENVYCELHLKLSIDDRGGFDNDRRIYFHEGKEKIENGKILIGHIGKHL